MYADAVVETESGASYPVHRVILAPLAPFFHKVFAGAFSESERRIVRIQQADERAVRLLLEFAYGGDVEVMSECATNLNVALETWKLAHRFGIPALMSIAASEATCLPRVETCIDVLRHARIYHCDSSAEVMFEYIAFNFAEVSRTAGFLKLEYDEVRALLSTTQLIASERDVLWAVLEWAKHDFARRKRLLEELMTQHVVFARLEARDVTLLAENSIILPPSIVGEALLSVTTRFIPVRGLCAINVDSDVVKCACARSKYGSPYGSAICCLHRMSKRKQPDAMKRTAQSFRVSMVRCLSGEMQDSVWRNSFLLTLPFGESVGKEFFYRRFAISVLNIALSLFFVLDMNSVEGSPFSFVIVVDRRVAAVGDKKDLFSEAAHLCGHFEVKLLSADGSLLSEVSERVPFTALCERRESTFRKRRLWASDFPLPYSSTVDVPCLKQDLEIWRHTDQEYNVLLNVTLSKIADL